MTAAADFDLSISLWPITDLAPYKRNARTHPQKQIDQIKSLIRQYGFTSPIIADRDDGGVIAAGHGRLTSVQQMLDDGETIKLPDGRALPDGYLPVIDCSGWTEDQRRAYTLADNQVAENSEWDTALLGLELDDLAQNGFDAGDLGFDQGDLKKMLGADGPQPVKGSLAERFGVPPFSVLNAREGWWQDRKRAWLALGIESEIGRDIAPTSVPDNLPDGHYMANRGNNAGGSIFDPVLCELAYRWFSKAGDVVLDPFAGGSVRGVVAAILGRQYHGIDLRAEQIEANVAQWADMDQDDVPTPQWYVGDSIDAPAIVDGMQVDFIFSCPPYADLEVYSDDPADLSTMAYADFLKAYRQIIDGACGQLRDNGFACFVVGDVRDADGNYHGFVNDTIDAFRDAGMHLYNEVILVTSVGSLPIRATKQFKAGRKLGKTHQNVLVFVKGTGKAATDRLGDVEFGKIEGVDDDWGEKL